MKKNLSKRLNDDYTFDDRTNTNPDDVENMMNDFICMKRKKNFKMLMKLTFNFGFWNRK